MNARGRAVEPGAACDCDCDCDEVLGSGVPADWTCVGSCGDGACDGVGCTIPV